MFELFLARDLLADLTESPPARLVTSILLAFSMLVAKRIAPAAPAAIATPPGNTALHCAAS
ncbi:hypothetical protein M0D69_41710 [Caballeronia sp. SEWSISQ10-4 2]|uniref:hypothetical protein n=1 Tax=Caballeronia sp. SEWSISQ10-4 2 TaxID=2937438 RepID=UPI002656D8F7|nr:hypothetical protein [Caballeronia sp. SEWSISQ10-4 2]MDN7184423.1 hypothetical protein [Caballeronia sp. SEWSISQ10-4 2]